MRATTTMVTLITDPIADEESRQVVRSLRGFVDVLGSPATDGTPTGSRSVFRLEEGDLVAGGLNARVDALALLGIGVHRILGDHPAVRVANRHLGYI
jgi:hypothetical protein